MKTRALIGAEKSVTECFVTKKEKWINKGIDKQCTIQHLIPKLCTKFQNPKSRSSLEQTFTENFPMHYIGVKGTVN